MQTQEEKDNYTKAMNLKWEVELWRDRTFNFIQLEVYEKCNESLFEAIRQKPVEDFVDDYLNSLSEYETSELTEDTSVEYNIEDPTEEDCKKYLVEHGEDKVREWAQENSYDENYPMLNTLFEFRSSPPAEWLDKAQEQGLGVIEETDMFKETLFIMSYGHSYFSSYWIPLYLSIFDSEKEKYKNINFSMV